MDDLKSKLGQGKKKSRPEGVSPNLFEETIETFESYDTVDDVLQECEEIGRKIRVAISQWTGPSKGKGREREQPSRGSSVTSCDEVWEDGALSLRSLASTSRRSKDFVSMQPRSLSSDLKLKEYQLLGLNWLSLMHSLGYSCILADEMGESTSTWRAAG